MSQLDFALQVGVDPTYLSSVEQGRRNVTLVMIRMLATGLDVAAGTLLEDG